MAKKPIRKTVSVKKEQIKSPANIAEKAAPTPEPIPEKVEIAPSKVVEAEVDETIKVTRAVAFYNKTDVVEHRGGQDYHLVRYKGVERFWSAQQTEIALKNPNVILVLDGSVKDTSANPYLEFPRKSQLVLKLKERRNCIGCGR